MTFSFTQEQVERLKRWRQYLETEGAKNWMNDVDQAVTEYNRVLGEAGFQSGSDLTGERLDLLFNHMKRLSHNRALSKLLYQENPLPLFNRKLRTLLSGTQPLAQRVDQFLDLTGVGEVVMSQFLCMHKPGEYPFFSWQTYNVLELDSTQEQQALDDALAEQSISSSNHLSHQTTAAYLQHAMVFREIKRLFNLDTYYMINEFLWNAFDLAEEEAPGEGLTSVSIEGDLRDYLAMNPSALEKGLELVGKEYDTKEVGRIDVLFKDRKGAYVVVETKKERESDKVIGQTARYMGWVSKKLQRPCRAIIIVGKHDERLDYAVIPFQNKIQLKYYKVRFDITTGPKTDRAEGPGATTQ